MRHAYMLKTKITHIKKQILSLNFLINCMSGSQAAQILSIKDESIFVF